MIYYCDIVTTTHECIVLEANAWMTMNAENETKIKPDTRTFIRKHWPIAAAVGVGVGAVGVALWLISRYVRERGKKDSIDMQALDRIEEVALRPKMRDAVLILETGPELQSIAGNVPVVAYELSDHIDDTDVADALTTIGDAVTLESRKR